MKFLAPRRLLRRLKLKHKAAVALGTASFVTAAIAGGSATLVGCESILDIESKAISGIRLLIADSNAQVKNGVSEISSAVSHMDPLTQQNAAMVQEATGAAQGLVQLAEASAFFRETGDTAQNTRNAA